ANEACDQKKKDFSARFDRTHMQNYIKQMFISCYFPGDIEEKRISPGFTLWSFPLRDKISGVNL
ncbi:MAG TPA: hypothetical protein VK145_01345, partial [Candidatus Nanoarchaeia archaeon]|nr:hypothetical protein [Candidatus Nanoarchaeia archaeon]